MVHHRFVARAAIPGLLVVTAAAFAPTAGPDRGAPAKDPAALPSQGDTFDQPRRSGRSVSSSRPGALDSGSQLDGFRERGASQAVGSSATPALGTQVTGNDAFSLGLERLGPYPSSASILDGVSRGFSGGPNNDDGNADSVFAGVQTPADADSGLAVSDYVDNTPLGTEALLQLATASDGLSEAGSRVADRSANVAGAINDASDSPIDVVSLPVEPSESGVDGQQPFRAAGHRFTEARSEVPAPGMLWLMALGLMLLAGIGWRRCSPLVMARADIA